MKRGIILLVLLLLLTSPLILAIEDDSTSIKEGTGEIKEQLTALQGGLDDKTENILEKEITISDELQIPMRIIFGIQDENTIIIERIIVLLSIWIIFFIIVKEILKLNPFLNKGWLNILGGFIVTIIIAMTGMIDKAAKFYFSLGTNTEWLNSLGPFKIIIAIIIVVVILFIGHIALKYSKIKLKLEKAEVVKKDISYLASIARTARTKNKEK
jgi:hypothetical protein